MLFTSYGTSVKQGHSGAKQVLDSLETCLHTAEVLLYIFCGVQLPVLTPSLKDAAAVLEMMAGYMTARDAGGVEGRASSALRALALQSIWEATRLMSLTPHLRQFIVSSGCSFLTASGSTVRAMHVKVALSTPLTAACKHS